MQDGATKYHVKSETGIWFTGVSNFIMSCLFGIFYDSLQKASVTEE